MKYIFFLSKIFFHGELCGNSQSLSRGGITHSLCIYELRLNTVTRPDLKPVVPCYYDTSALGLDRSQSHSFRDLSRDLVVLPFPGSHKWIVCLSAVFKFPKGKVQFSVSW